MSSSEFIDSYIKALERAELYQDKAMGLTTYLAPGVPDQFLISQHNTLIELMVDTSAKLDKILEKLEQLLKKTSLEKSDIESLTEQMLNLRPIEPKEKTLPKEYKFGYAKKGTVL